VPLPSTALSNLQNIEQVETRKNIQKNSKKIVKKDKKEK